MRVAVEQSLTRSYPERFRGDRQRFGTPARLPCFNHEEKR